MAVTKQKKQEILQGLEKGLKSAKSVIFINFHGLNMKASTELRKILRGMGVKYIVAKKTLIKIVFEKLGISGDMPALNGEIAMAFSEGDPMDAARELEKFSKKNGIGLLGGVFENKYIDSKAVVMLANIPPREVLLAMFVNIINSPVQGLVGTLNGLTSKFVRTLGEISKIKQ